MFILDGRTLSPDMPFEHDGISYPANWLRLSSHQEREAIGIEDLPDPEPFDHRFYFGPNQPRDHAQLVEAWVLETRATANSILSASDWLVVREIDNGTAVPQDWRTWREAIRSATSTKCESIRETTDTDELAAYINGADYGAWPADPSVPVG
ncbi:hypothetical protein EBT31_08125 [bacterium]|nr:hypothetical protein [bacterium]